MCCIFTCCGWMVDLLQRVWVFLMSCCISAAVCCVLITSSMSGVALGYNYSLAEYIDTKETNVSVYIKRGVFDDDIANDLLDMRRSGGKATMETINNDNLKAPREGVGPDEVPPPESGRRLDNSLMESNDNKNFEGSLMKLTLKPPFPSTTQGLLPDDSAMIPVMTSYPADSLDQLKAIQELINARKSGVVRQFSKPSDGDSVRPIHNEVNSYMRAPSESPDSPDHHRRMMSEMLGFRNQQRQYQRKMGDKEPSRDMQIPDINPARFAVPSILSQGNWEAAKIPKENYRRADNILDNLPEDHPTMPSPVTYKTGPIRPPTTESSTVLTPRRLTTFAPQKVTQATPTPEKSIEEQNIEVKSSGEERFDERSGNEDDRKKDFLEKLPGPKIVGQDNTEYYDEELKGLPVRRKRSIDNVKSKLPRAKLGKAIPQKVNPGHLAKSKLGKSTNEITDYPSVLSKLHFLNNPLSNETTSTNEKEVRNGTKTVALTNGTRPIIEMSIGKALKIIQSMFS